MQINSVIAVLGLVVSLAVASHAGGVSSEQLAAAAVSGNPSTAGAAIRELRQAGPSGVEALLKRHAAEIERHKATNERSEQWRRITAAIDAVAMQKDAYTSGLYWYTDLEEAKRAAKASGKPILSLRLLGNLNEEFSCANSRLFRSVLYANHEVSDYLRSNYILHWKSVRNAPRITIDFGDGRKIERTITGNSIHYVLDAEGRIIDGIPGLYTPAAFLGYVRRAHAANAATAGKPEKERQKGLLEFRQKAFGEIKKNREAAIAKAGVQLAETRTGTLAILAAPMAVAKMVVVDEYSILRVYDDFAKFEPSIRFDDWEKLAKVYAPDAGPDEHTVAMIGRQVASTGMTADEMKSMFARLANFTSLDTTRNDFLFHTKVYEWLNQQRGVRDVEQFNALVYDRLFQTPNTDKWLGLYSSDVYTALDGNGIVK